VQFPIRDVRGQAVGFGGRILPGSALASRGPKYYNSCDTPLFAKSEQLYGIDQARAAAEKAGYLAVVEGYTDSRSSHPTSSSSSPQLRNRRLQDGGTGGFYRLDGEGRQPPRFRQGLLRPPQAFRQDGAP